MAYLDYSSLNDVGEPCVIAARFNDVECQIEETIAEDFVSCSSTCERATCRLTSSLRRGYSMKHIVEQESTLFVLGLKYLKRIQIYPTNTILKLMLIVMALQQYDYGHRYKGLG